jgi:hypothetical protein
MTTTEALRIIENALIEWRNVCFSESAEIGAQQWLDVCEALEFVRPILETRDPPSWCLTCEACLVPSGDICTNCGALNKPIAPNRSPS